MNKKNALCRTGIWGFGVVGKSALMHILDSNTTVSVFDQRTLNSDERALLRAHNVHLYKKDELPLFLEENDSIIPSPGIKLEKYHKHRQKFMCELDLFCKHWQKPTIAITGTVGKTTTTSLLSHILTKHGLSVATGGNIGTPMLDLIKDQHKVDLAILELSSFQLELSYTFAPTIAIWTNFFVNHLNYHPSISAYKKAKCNLFAQQTKHNYAIIPQNLKESVPQSKAQKILFTHEQPLFGNKDRFYYCDQETLSCSYRGHKSVVIRRKDFDKRILVQNVLPILAVLEILKISPDVFVKESKSFNAHEHRMEHVATKDGVVIYNDSKATIVEATRAALDSVRTMQTVLILGGLSKGVDRGHLFKDMPSSVKTIICFGREADVLYNLAQGHNRSAFVCSDLEDAVTQALNKSRPGECILFSPSGASFDLFTNYQERGARFKEIIMQLLP